MNQMVDWWRQRRWRQRHWHADIRYMISAADTYTGTTTVCVIYIFVGLSFDALQPLSPPIYVENRSDYYIQAQARMDACNGCLHGGNKNARDSFISCTIYLSISWQGKKKQELNGTHGIMSLVKYCFVVDDYTTFCLIDINGPVCSVCTIVGWIRTEITHFVPSFASEHLRDGQVSLTEFCPMSNSMEPSRRSMGYAFWRRLLFSRCFTMKIDACVDNNLMIIWHIQFGQFEKGKQIIATDRIRRICAP